jgi:DNA-binding SARP family transcriptional activator
VTAAGSIPAVRIALCGELRLEIDGRRRERELPGRLGRVLLAYLAINRRRAVPRDELIGALWPRGAPADPGRTLSTLLSGLRRCLGADHVQGRSQIRLVVPDGTDIDFERALADAERARTALVARDLEASAAHSGAAIAVLERELLPGFDAPWLEEQRRELEEFALGALEVLARASLEAEGDAVQRAQVAARRLVALAPYRESGHALLMEAQAARGNVAEALQTFDRLRRVMRDELGTAPSPEVREAYQRLLERVDDTGGPVLPLQGTVARMAGRPFVGRDALNAALERNLDAATSGSQRFCFLAGEPGIGKSHLAARFAHAAYESGRATVLYGRAEPERLVPYQPWVDVISHWVEHGPADDVLATHRFELEQLGRLVPQLRRGLPPPVDASAMPPGPDAPVEAAERHEMFEAVATILSSVAGDGTLVLVLDDLHWADGPSLHMVRHLARHRAPARLMVVATYRDTELAPKSRLTDLIADLRREHVLDFLPVGGLDDRETRSLIDTHGLDSLDGAGARRLWRMTGGSPLFLEEALGALADAADDGVTPDRALADLGVPEGIKEVVLRRVDRLDGPAREVLTVGAVAGDEFPPELVRAAHGTARADEVDAALDRAVAARLLLITDGVALGFSHALVREALYEGLGEFQRARLHLRVAEALEERRAEPAELARHFFAARHLAGPEPAIRYAREAAERAVESLAWDDAARALQRALEADELRNPPDLDDRCELLLALGHARRRGGHADAQDAFTEAAELARGRNPAQLARAALGWASPYYQTARTDRELVALLREALKTLPSGRGDLRARLLARLAECRQFGGHSGEAAELSAQAVDLAERLGDDEVLVAALSGRQLSLMHAETLGERLTLGRRLVDLAQRMHTPERELHALHPHIFDLLELGQVAEAREQRERLECLARDLRQPLFAHFAAVWSCTFAQIDGDLDGAERLALEAFAMRQPVDPQGAARILAAQLYVIRFAQGRLGELVDEAQRMTGEYPSLSVWRAAVPLAQAVAGNDEAAGEGVRTMVAGLDGMTRDVLWLSSMWILSETALLLGAADAAGPLYGALSPYAERWVQAGQGGNAGPVSRVLGRLAALRGEHDTAVVHLDHAVRASAAAGARAFEAAARADRAEVLAATRTPG